MLRIALKMLFGDKIKLVMLLVGLMMPVMLIAQQGGMFTGFMKLFSATIDRTNAPVWIMNKKVRFSDQDIPMYDSQLNHVRTIKGIEWAAPFTNVMVNIRLRGGNSEMSLITGIDSSSYIGLPSKIVEGDYHALKDSDTVFVDKTGMKKLGNPKVGDYLEINDKEVKVVGIVDIPQGFQAFPCLYTSYENAKKLAPFSRKNISFILAKPKAGEDINVLKKRISDEADLKMLTAEEFKWMTYDYYNTDTSLPAMFGVTILFGIIVGTIIVAQTFYTFVLENIRQFGTLKALGASNKTLVKMILTQSLVMAVISYFIAMGLTCFLSTVFVEEGMAGMTIPVPLMIFAFVIVICSSIFSSLISILKVIRLEPAMVFKG